MVPLETVAQLKFFKKELKRRLATKTFQALFLATLLLMVSVVFALLSFYPQCGEGEQTTIIIDDTFTVTSQETRQEGLGSFHGGENITLAVSGLNGNVNFTLLTYSGLRYSDNQTDNINYSFVAGADYYEAVFDTKPETSSQIHFQVAVQKIQLTFPYAWLNTPAKAMFLVAWAALLGITLKIAITRFSSPNNRKPNFPRPNIKSHRILKCLIVVSTVFWLFLLVVNTYPLGTFENWYTDHARNPYSAALFTKNGLEVFSTPLGTLASKDNSFFKYVTWPEMPHLYPIGSILLFLPFGLLLENAVAPIQVYKLEIAIFLLVANICLYFFLKRYWKQDMGFFWKGVGIYAVYIVLIVYSANGMFDTVALIFSLAALAMFLESRYDLVLLLSAVAATVKYQAGIFLLPLAVISAIILFHHQKPMEVIRNKFVAVALALAAVNLFTAYLSAPYLIQARPELVLNGVNAFSPHSQLPWEIQFLAVIATLTVTLVCFAYLFNRNRVVSIFMIFSLLPAFTMPYFQPWYLPSFFIYALFPADKRALEVTMFWIIFITLVLSFGGFGYNPLTILENTRKVLRFG